MSDIVAGAKGVASTLKGAQAAGKELGSVVSGQQAEMEKTVQEAHRNRMQAKAQEERIRNAADYQAFAKFEEEKQKEKELQKLKDQATAKYGKDAWMQVEALKTKLQKEREEEAKLMDTDRHKIQDLFWWCMTAAALVTYFFKLYK
jgi:hypothetical protein